MRRKEGWLRARDQAILPNPNAHTISCVRSSRRRFAGIKEALLPLVGTLWGRVVGDALQHRWAGGAGRGEAEAEACLVTQRAAQGPVQICSPAREARVPPAHTGAPP